MKRRMKNRLALLGILLIAGLFIVLSVPVRTEFTSSEGVSVAIEGSQGTIYKDDKVLQTFTLPRSYFEGEEDYEYTWNSSNISEGGIRIGKKVIKKVEIPEVQLNELIETSMEDNRVWKIIEEKEYKVTAATIDPLREKNDTRIYSENQEALMVLEVEGKHYQIRINLLSKTVSDVREQASRAVIIYYTTIEACK